MHEPIQKQIRKLCIQTELRIQLEEIQSTGIQIYLKNEKSTPNEIADFFVKEDSIYMPDYILNENGEVEEIRFDRIQLL